MYTVLATFRLQEGKEQEAEAVLQELAGRVQADEPGTIAYLFHRAKDDPRRIVVFEVYRDEAAFEAHRQGALRELMGKLGPLVEPGSAKLEFLERVAGFQRP
ncbi:MAG: antibiotic biosynthesis monooxygenase [Dehalococcoidia bacterium]|jgi:quinol monooxygenase YgiN|nr:antibiotic biosynthesis monooxygenase [Dehalococcoidia bacterium]MDW8008039.1 putative quinol monooxygenase [Chloroflexota bacterium]